MAKKAPDILAETILKNSGRNDYSCVAVCYHDHVWLVATNGLNAENCPFPASIRRDDAELLHSEGMHAEMRIVSKLLDGKSSTVIKENMFENLYIGVSKDICKKCAAILDFLGIKHRDTHNRPTSQDTWEFPHSFFANHFSDLNDGVFAHGEDRNDSDYDSSSFAYKYKHGRNRKRPY